MTDHADLKLGRVVLAENDTDSMSKHYRDAARAKEAHDKACQSGRWRRVYLANVYSITEVPE